MNRIHKLASVDTGAELGDNVEIGPFAVIEQGAVIGDGCVIGPHAYITQFVRLAENVVVYKGASVGTEPQDLKFEGEDTTLEIGARTVIREFATLNRGTKADWKTTVGEDCLLMAYSHVAHDCHLGNHVILVNAVNMGGHVHIGDWAIIGGGGLIHQFVRVGRHVMAGGGTQLPYDIPPFVRCAGRRAEYSGVNSIGLRRRGFSDDSINQVKRAYRFLYRKKLSITHALKKIRDEVELTDEVREIVDFVESREDRGIMR